MVKKLNILHFMLKFETMSLTDTASLKEVLSQTLHIPDEGKQGRDAITGNDSVKI